MGMLVCIAIVSNFSFVAYRLYVPFFDEVSQIPVNCGKANTLVEEFFVKVLGCWMIVTVNNCVMDGAFLPRHSTGWLVRRGRVAHANASVDSSRVKTVCVHNLGPCSDEVGREHGLIVILCVNFCDGS